MNLALLGHFFVKVPLVAMPAELINGGLGNGPFAEFQVRIR